jgi:hypothetical protein
MPRRSRVPFLACLITLTFLSTPYMSAEDEQGDNEWIGTVEQKVSGLMTVWAEVKYNYPFFDK